MSIYTITLKRELLEGSWDAAADAVASLPQEEEERASGKQQANQRRANNEEARAEVAAEFGSIDESSSLARPLRQEAVATTKPAGQAEQEEGEAKLVEEEQEQLQQQSK